MPPCLFFQDVKRKIYAASLHSPKTADLTEPKVKYWLLEAGERAEERRVGKWLITEYYISVGQEPTVLECSAYEVIREGKCTIFLKWKK